jgi:hypothetical protein
MRKQKPQRGGCVVGAEASAYGKTTDPLTVAKARLFGAVLHDEAGVVEFFDRPRRREAADDMRSDPSLVH